jgi:hypothetical protein
MVRYFAALALLAAAGAAALAQTASVVELTPDDAAVAKRLYDQQAAITKQIADLQVKIRNKYLIQPCQTARPSVEFCASSSTWFNGFEYSTDFKFIVPKPLPTYPTTTCGYPILCGTTLTPAFVNTPAISSNDPYNVH